MGILNFITVCYAFKVQFVVKIIIPLPFPVGAGSFFSPVYVQGQAGFANWRLKLLTMHRI